MAGEITGGYAYTCPEIYVNHDEKDENLLIDVMLPGVEKASIDLEFTRRGFCVKATDEGRRILYLGCYNLAHEVYPDKARARYENGILKIVVPFKKEKAVKVKLEE